MVAETRSPRAVLVLITALCTACGARTLDTPYGTDASACPNALTACDGGCTLTSLDPLNCGGCGHVCAAGTPCLAGSCASACPVGLTLCAQTCVSTLNDTSNCGACGAKCAAGQACVAGACSYECPPGQTLCGGDGGPVKCADLASNAEHCGACSNACSANHALSTCQQGACKIIACSKGFDDCNANATDGCEVDLAKNQDDCGRCGHGCCGGQCTGGVCQPVEVYPAYASAIAADATQVFWGGGGGVFWCWKGTCSPTMLTAYTATDIVLNSTDLFGLGQAPYRSIYRCAKTGCGGTPQVLLPKTGAVALASDDNYVYWVEEGSGTNGTVWSCDANGCSSPTLLANAQVDPTTITVDGNNHLLAWNNGDLVEACHIFNPACLNSTFSAAGQSVVAMANDGSDIYWTNSKDGSVRKCSFLGGCSNTTATLAAGYAQPRSIAVDATNVYWTSSWSGGGVFSCAKVGCASPTQLAPSAVPAEKIAIDAACVYWSASGGLNVVAKP